MTPYVVQHAEILGVLVVGTRLALARPPRYFFIPPDAGHPVRIPGGHRHRAGSFGLPQFADALSAPLLANYGILCTLAAIAVLTVLFTRVGSTTSRMPRASVRHLARRESGTSLTES
jgi:hypothetical protein